jgi:hypothetical protein
MAAVTLGGCAGMVNSVSDFMGAGPWWESAQTDKITSRARELEAHGELTMALDHWRLVDRITGGQAAASRKISRIQSKITEAVNDHYRNGMAELRKKNRAAARNHFLAALRLDPAFQPALIQINARFSTFPLAARLSVPGDRPATVAEKAFDDKGKAFLVAWFNDLPVDEVMTPGTLLILPKLEKTPPKKAHTKEPPNRLAEANALLAENDLDGALAIVKQANPDDPDVKALLHAIHLRQAIDQIEAGLPEAARPYLAMVPAGFAGKDAALESLQAALQRRQTSLALEKARAHFDQGEYQQSLDILERTQKDETANVAIRDLAAEARYRLALDHFDRKRFLEARDVLEKADGSHEAGMALKETVRSRLVDLAQIHYRNGVKHFINEDLKSAIADWEMALACNPDHGKARENIENARRLMQKVETLP